MNINELEPEIIPIGLGCDWVAWFAIAAMSGDERDKSSQIAKNQKEGIGGQEIIMLINGVQVSVTRALRRVEEELDDLILKRAVQLVKERTGELWDKLDVVQRTLVDMVEGNQ
jgi:hypothetical protein